jgi:hypothetical protein
MLSIARTALEPFTRQHNTGNCYEIFVILTVLRKMGLTNEEHEEMRGLINAITEVNARSASKINGAYQDLLKTAAGTGAFYNGVKIIGLRNVTQDDGDGGTGDLILILADGQEKSVSICQGTHKRNGDIEKCLSNPSCKRYGCNDDDVIFLKEIALSAVPAYKEEMKAAYGENEEDWPSRIKTRAANTATALASLHTMEKFTRLSGEEKKAVFEDLLRVKEGSKPADVLCLVNEGCTRLFLFEIKGLNPACTWEPALKYREPCFMEMYLGEVLVGETQVKFNNGVYHKGKTSSLTSSWNATAVMNKVFDLTPLNL